MRNIEQRPRHEYRLLFWVWLFKTSIAERQRQIPRGMFIRLEGCNTAHTGQHPSSRLLLHQPSNLGVWSKISHFIRKLKVRIALPTTFNKSLTITTLTRDLANENVSCGEVVKRAFHARYLPFLYVDQGPPAVQ
jgi:hypothetical protein